MEENQIADMMSEGGAGQGEQGTETPVAPTPPAGPDYKAMYEAEQARVAQMMQLQQQTLSAIQQRPGVAPVAEPDVFAGFEPETAKALKAVTDKITANFQIQLAQVKQQTAAQAAVSQVQNLAAVTPGMTPELTREAANLYANLAAKGIPVNAEDIINMTLGQAMRAGKLTNGPRGAPIVLNGGAKPRAPSAEDIHEQEF